MEWLFYGREATNVYVDAFNVDLNFYSLGPRNNGYRELASGMLCPKKTVYEKKGDVQSDPIEFNARMEKEMINALGNGWKQILDERMSLEELTKSNPNFLVMDHAEYYLSCVNTANAKALLEELKQYDTCEHNKKANCIKIEDEQKKRKEAFTQMERQGLIKKQTHKQNAFYNHYEIVGILAETIMQGKSTIEQVEAIKRERHTDIAFIRDHAEKLLISRNDDFAISVRKECLLALKDHKDNRKEKIKNIAWLAKTSSRKLIKSLKAANKEFQYRGLIYNPKFYKNPTDTKKRKREHTFLFINESKRFKNGTKRVKGRVPQIERALSLSAIRKFFLRGLIYVRAFFKSLLLPISLIFKYWKVSLVWFGFIAILDIFTRTSATVQYVLLIAPIVVITVPVAAQMFLVIASDDCEKYDALRIKPNKRVRAAVFGKDPGVPICSIEDLARGTVIMNKPVIIRGNAYVEETAGNWFVNVSNPRNKKHIAQFASANLIAFKGKIPKGLVHITLFGIVTDSGVPDVYYIETKSPHRFQVYFSPAVKDEQNSEVLQKVKQALKEFVSAS